MLDRHRFKIIVMVAALCLGIVGAVLAAPSAVTVLPGSMPYHDSTVVQNTTAIAPMKAGNVCVTKTIHNKADTVAVFNLYTSNRWYRQASWKVVKTADGTDFVVQRLLGSNTVGTPGANGGIAVNREYTTYTLKPFGNNSSASLTACQDRQ